MQKRISNLPFTGTPEQEEKLNAVLARHKGEKGARKYLVSLLFILSFR